VTYGAHKARSEWDQAVADASELVKNDPEDKDFWWWRAVAREAKGDLVGAAADYQQSLVVEPRLSGIPFNLANVYERLGRPCEAKAPIEQFLRYHPTVSDRPRIDERLARLEAACKATGGAATAPSK
jgi:aspartyl protease family protein